MHSRLKRKELKRKEETKERSKEKETSASDIYTYILIDKKTAKIAMAMDA